MRIAYRLHTPLSLVAPVLAALLTAIALTRGGTALLAVTGVAALALVAVVASLKPEHVFLFWLFAAPFLQDTGSGRLQHVVRIALYSAPPLFFLAWSLLERRTVRGSLVDLLPGAYLVYAVGSALVAGVNVSATQVFAIVATGVIVYYFCVFASLEEAIERRVATVLLVTNAIVSGVVITGKVAGQSFGYAINTSGSLERATGVFGDPAFLGTFVGVGFAIALAVLVWEGPASLRRLSLVCLLLDVPALFLSLTRGPLIAAGAVSLVILLSRARTRWPGVLAGIVVALVVAGLWSSIASTSLYRDRFSNQSNVQARVLIDRWSFELAGRKPLLGWGYGSFDRVKNSANLSAAGSGLPRSVGLQYTSHNTYLTILVELGGVGLLLLLAPWLIAMRSSLRLFGNPTSSGWLATGLLGALGVWIINAGTFDLRFFPLAWVLPWLAVGLLRRMTLDREQLGQVALAA